MPLDNVESKAPRSLVVGPCVLSFPVLFVPRQVLGQGDPAYSATFLFDPRTQKDQIELMFEACVAAADRTWPNGEWKKKRALRDSNAFWWPIRNGDEKSERKGYGGMTFVSARSKTKPGVVDQAVQPVLEQEKIYPGLIVNAGISFFGFTMPRWGIGCGLNNVQIVREGERLGGKPDPSEDFVPIAGFDKPQIQKDWLA